jgi:hypothetical protein
MVTRNGEEEAWLFNFAMQNPMFMSISKLVAVEQFFPTGSAENAWPSAFFAWHPHVFEVSWLDNHSASVLHEIKASDVSVLQGVHREGSKCCSDQEAVPLPAFLARLPPKAQRTRSANKHEENRSPSSSDLVKQLPWAEKIFEKFGKQKHADGIELPIDPASLPDTEDDLEFLGDSLGQQGERAWAELEQLRDEWDAGPDQRQGDFWVHVLGGNWQLAHKGVVADAIQGRCGNQAIEWCRSQGVAYTARFEIATFSEAHAAVMARCWCSKMQHFFNIGICTGRTAFSEADMSSWTEPSEFTLLAHTTPIAHKRLHKRIDGLRKLFAA